jgi:hypothetical protein
MGSLKVNSCDFNLSEVATLQKFKQDHEHGFCIGKDKEEIEAVFNQLKSAKDGNDTGAKEKVVKPSRKRDSDGIGGNSGK